MSEWQSLVGQFQDLLSNTHLQKSSRGSPQTPQQSSVTQDSPSSAKPLRPVPSPFLSRTKLPQASPSPGVFRLNDSPPSSPFQFTPHSALSLNELEPNAEDDLLSKYDHVVSENQSLHSKVLDLQTSLSQYQAKEINQDDIDDLQETVKALSESLEEREGENDLLREQVNGFNYMKHTLVEEIESLKKIMKEQDGRLEQFKSEVHEEKSVLLQEIENLKYELSQSTHSSSDTQTHLSQQIVDLKVMIKKLEKDAEKLKTNLCSEQQKNTLLRRDLAESRDSLKTSLDSKNSELAQSFKTIESITAQLSSIEGQLKDEMSLRKQEVGVLEDQEVKLKEELSVREDKISELHGLVSDLKEEGAQKMTRSHD
ncbi:hypothetical protein GEMRC1_006552 [Eukaryota sp. GEM-RC1]